MPTYEYLCKTCSHRFETWQKMTDEPLTVCPECGAQIRRVLFPAGVVFKGSGFYSTDHSSSKSSAVGTNGENKSTETSSESKPSGESKTTSENKSSGESSSKSESKTTPSTSK